MEVLRTLVTTVQNLTGVQFGNEEELLAQILAALDHSNILQEAHTLKTVSVKNSLAAIQGILNSFIPLFNQMISILLQLKHQNQGHGNG